MPWASRTLIPQETEPATSQQLPALALQGSRDAGSMQVTWRMSPISSLLLQGSERCSHFQMKLFSHLPFVCPPFTFDYTSPQVR